MILSEPSALLNSHAFFVVHLVHERVGSFDLRDYAGLSRRAPLLAFTLAACLLSLIGIPPFACLLGSLYLLGSLIEKGMSVSIGLPYSVLAVIGALNTAFVAYHSTALVRTMVVAGWDDNRPAINLRIADKAWLLFFSALTIAPTFAWPLLHRWASASNVLGSSP